MTRVTFIRFVVVSFLFGISAVPIVLAAEKKFPKPPIEFPQRHGMVTDYFPSPKPSKQTVVIIQDLHANVGVQKNIASMIYRLLKKNALPRIIVCVEGASGEGDVSLLRSLPRGVRRLFEEMLLRKAYLTGAELAATEAAAELAQQQAIWGHRMKEFFKGREGIGPVTLSPVLLWGVDDPDLYRNNWRAAKIVDKQRYQAMQEFSNTRTMLQPGANPVLLKHLGLVTKLLLLRLQPQEYYEYLKNRALTPKGPPIYQSTIAAAEEYYRMAEERSVAMANNVLKRMGSTPGYTVLVTGGFHTQEISVQFKKRGVAHMVVTPDVKVLDQDQAYKARLREEE
jgi:hypothetical protein